MRLPIILYELFVGASADDPDRTVQGFIATEADALALATAAGAMHRSRRLLKPSDDEPGVFTAISLQSSVAYASRTVIAELPVDSIEAARAAGYAVDEAAVADVYTRVQGASDEIKIALGLLEPPPEGPPEEPPGGGEP